jgi:hypothetical protein
MFKCRRGSVAQIKESGGSHAKVSLAREPIWLGKHDEAVVSNDGDRRTRGLDLLHLGDGNGLHGRNLS